MIGLGSDKNALITSKTKTLSILCAVLFLETSTQEEQYLPASTLTFLATTTQDSMTLIFIQYLFARENYYFSTPGETLDWLVPNAGQGDEGPGLARLWGLCRPCHRRPPLSLTQAHPGLDDVINDHDYDHDHDHDYDHDDVILADMMGRRSLIRSLLRNSSVVPTRLSTHMGPWANPRIGKTFKLLFPPQRSGHLVKTDY